MVKRAAESVNINNDVELVAQAMKQLESKRPEGFSEKISILVEFLTDSEKQYQSF